MYTNVNLAAPIGAMAFLGTGLLFFVSGLIFLYTVIKAELAGTKVVVSAIAAVSAVYIGFLLFFSLRKHSFNYKQNGSRLLPHCETDLP